MADHDDHGRPPRTRDLAHQIEVLRIAERFFDSVVLFGLHECGALRALGRGPATFDEIQDAVRGDARLLRSALDAAVGLGVLTRSGSRYVAPDAIVACLSDPDNSAHLGALVSFLGALVSPLSQLGADIHGSGRSGALLPGRPGDARPAGLLTAAMETLAQARGLELVERVDFSSTRRLLDVGSGPGTYAFAILERYPEARATLVDFPEAIGVARTLGEQRGLSSRTEFVAADALAWHPRERFDTVLLSNTLHMLGPDTSCRLLAHCRSLMVLGGRVVVQAQFLNEDRTSPRWPVLLNLMQVAMTPAGQNHTVEETTAWLEGAGFGEVRLVPFSPWNTCSCLVAVAV